MADPAVELLTAVRRLATSLGIDPERVQVRVYKPERGYTVSSRWRASAWVSRPGRSWSVEDALRAGDEIAADERGATAEDAAARTLSWLRARIAGRRDEYRRAAKRAASDAEVYQRALDALDGGDRDC